MNQFEKAESPLVFRRSFHESANSRPSHTHPEALQTKLPHAGAANAKAALEELEKPDAQE
jgi:hypothetical protein